jgi:parvulin-like peptidyl-prolyl isomerase
MNSLSKGKIFATVVLLALRSSAGAKMLEDTVAVVNGQPILLSEYQKELSTSMDYWNHTEPDALKDPANLKKLRETTLEELINRELLYQEGVKQKVKVRERDIDNGVAEIKARFAPENAKELPPDQAEAKAEANFKKQLEADGMTMAQFREKLSKQIMARKLIDDSVRQKVAPPEEAAVKAYFDKVVKFIDSKSAEVPKGMSEEETLAFRQIALQVKGLSSERVRVSRVLVKTSPNPSPNEKKRALKTAQDIKKKLDGGAVFSEVARADSEDPESAPRGGDLGYVMRGVAPAEFEKTAFSLPVGEVSEPFYVEGGYNIIRVAEKRAAEPPDYDRFKEELAKFMMNIQFQKELEVYVKSIKAKAVIERSLAAASH